MRRSVKESARELLVLLKREAAGAENALPLADLGERLDLPWRSVARLLQALRQDGWLIGTSRTGEHRGAFWPVTPADQAAALTPYARAFSSMAQVYNRLKRHAPHNVVMAVERQVQTELFEE